MLAALGAYLGLLALLAPFLDAAKCPESSPAVPIPGCWGESGCAYIIASQLGGGAGCEFDYCNCRGIYAPLLPTIVRGTPTVGCGAYTTVPESHNCPTGPARIPSEGSVSAGGANNGEVGGNIVTAGEEGSLPTPVTTGGPLSTASDAFDTTAPPVTTLSYQGGVLTYTRATFTPLSTQSGTTTIVGVITKTAGAGGPVATFVGPIAVGPRGIFWGPPGTSPFCVWPFCLWSNDRIDRGGTIGSNTGGGAGGTFGCLTCVGGFGTDGLGGGSRGGGNSGGGDSNGDDNDNNEDYGDDSDGDDSDGDDSDGDDSDGDDSDDDDNDEPSSQKCLVARGVERPDPVVATGGHLVKRAEEVKLSSNPLKDAFNTFRSTKGSNLAIAVIDSADNIIVNKLPKEKRNSYVTGLQGKFSLGQKMAVGAGENANIFPAGSIVQWVVRWDFDPQKGPHVNVAIGKPSSKFAYNLDPSKYLNGDASETMNKIEDELNDVVKYPRPENWGKDTTKIPLEWDTTIEKAKEDLKTYFKSVVNAPC